MKKIKAEEYMTWDKTEYDLGQANGKFDIYYPTPLQALEDIRECLYGDVYAGVEKKLDIIETALKRLEELDSAYTLTNHNGKFYVVIDKTEFNRMLKQLKVLQIIGNLPQEEKQVLLNAVYTYTKSEEKYNLLEEVLL